MKNRCTKYRDPDGRHRIVSENKAKSCASRGCPYLQSFIPRKENRNVQAALR